MQSSHTQEPSKVVCRYSKKPSGCKNPNCKFFHPQQDEGFRSLKRRYSENTKEYLNCFGKRKKRRMSLKDKVVPDIFTENIAGSFEGYQASFDIYDDHAKLRIDYERTKTELEHLKQVVKELRAHNSELNCHTVENLDKLQTLQRERDDLRDQV